MATTASSGTKPRCPLARIVLLVALAACTAVPDVDDAIDAPVSANAPAQIVGPRGPLTDAQSRAVITRLTQEGKNAGVLERHIAIEGAFGDSPLTTGNRVTLLRDGTATLAAMFGAIQSARDHINLEYFTFEDVVYEGVHIVDLLSAKARAGVSVNLIYDGIGSGETPRDVFAKLTKAGVKLVEFNPVNLTAVTVDASANHRDHRKILVVDGRIGIAGGVNLSAVYTGVPPTPAGPAVRPDKRPPPAPDVWRDTDLEIEGPAVKELHLLFLATWTAQKGPPLDAASSPLAIEAKGQQVVQIIGSDPETPLPLFYAALLSAIRNAESRIWLAEGYFVPTHQALEDLIAAARRGVDVRLLLPSQSDSQDALYVGRSHYSDLLEAGVKIYEVEGATLHSKVAAIDGVWTSVGSSNFDRRSVVFNNEVDAVVLGRETAAATEAMFESDFARAKQIDPADWNNRPLAERLKEMISPVWEYWL
ncbi:MAG TPA: phospholipase D-like domain-containing protein [Candidatus Cybelea sp.]|nr:phospholipase D-like domain-containing protein [Candidatus Cybelea sp.]